jgi:hypothetical protein
MHPCGSLQSTGIDVGLSLLTGSRLSLLRLQEDDRASGLMIGKRNLLLTLIVNRHSDRLIFLVFGFLNPYGDSISLAGRRRWG